jgi:hypothetical protein
MKKEVKANFLQVGKIIECGSCHPEKFKDCKKISLMADPWFKDYKCSCVCHEEPMRQNPRWIKGMEKKTGKDFGLK